MAAELSLNCQSCGKRHILVLVTADFFEPEKGYGYTCPKTGAEVHLSAPEEWARIVQVKPHDAVVVTERS